MARKSKSFWTHRVNIGSNKVWFGVGSRTACSCFNCSDLVWYRPFHLVWPGNGKPSSGLHSGRKNLLKFTIVNHEQRRVHAHTNLFVARVVLIQFDIWRLQRKFWSPVLQFLRPKKLKLTKRFSRCCTATCANTLYWKCGLFQCGSCKHIAAEGKTGHWKCFSNIVGCTRASMFAELKNISAGDICLLFTWISAKTISLRGLYSPPISNWTTFRRKAKSWGEDAEMRWSETAARSAARSRRWFPLNGAAQIALPAERAVPKRSRVQIAAPDTCLRICCDHLCVSTNFAQPPNSELLLLFLLPNGSHRAFCLQTEWSRWRGAKPRS